ncbi:TAXI family TRAP transporter solute-binding subunit [Oceanobacillus halophilus]|uniref:TAXI family TRAP transporter solute-binding subunit n=1 Tax=Oceanobacillus halophilus TaxID=930130 RepID=A0A494ZXE9_9BACI|nr:TAXI family TRAP transporter solute-binding subunit [Oceanobacillus halophilus]RKQ29657.1 TAXI family TRAP transporter solute-binding subunit [Oceanobacillus halophilus]
MFKRLIIILLFGLVFLTGCGKEESTVSNTSQSKSESNEVIQTTIMGGRTGGAWSVFTEGVAESIRRENNEAIITVEPGGIVENPLTVGTNKAPYGLSYSMTAYAAYSGEEPYNQSFEDIRAISVVIPANYYQFIVRADFKYDSLESMFESKAPLRLSVDQKGSAGEIITRNIFQEYGVTYDDIVDWGGSVDHLGGSKTFELMADKRIDATGDAVSVPSSDIIEASTTNELKLFSLTPEIVQRVSDNLGMDAGTIEAGSYDFLETDINTVNTPAILIVNKEVPKKEVYQVTKSIYDNLDYLGTVHEEFKNLTSENMIDVGSVPLHPGAEEFFKEIGVLD